MTQIIINDILPYTQATAIASQTIFSTNWTANQASDVVVYYTPNGQQPNDLTQLLATNLYTVQFIGGNRTVQITLVNAASAGDMLTITRNTPASFLNLYTNTNFVPSMLNNDFGILTLVDQQAQVIDDLITPRYNYSAFINQAGPGADTILPILGANQIWAKNPSNTGMIAVDLNEIISGGTVTQINTGLGLNGGPITDAGTISFGQIPAHTFWGNVTGSTALPTTVATSYFLAAQNNLLDLNSIPTAVANLGLTIGTNVEAWSAALDSIAGLTTSANQLLRTTASNTYATIAAAANSVLVTSAGSVPSLSQTLPTAVQSNITQLGTQTQALNMGTHLINNVVDPVSLQDAATKNYVDSAGGAFLPLAGGTMSGIINMGNHKITNLTDPTSAQDAATKNYTDITFLPLAGGTMSGIINMNSHKITNLTNPSVSADAANKAYVDTTVGNYLPLAGGTMSGVIDMGNHKIINVTDPTLNQDAVNLEYLNTQLALYLPLAGGTMTGAINMNSHKITSLTDPTNPQDAATKNYVDSVATGFTVKQAVQAATTGSNLTATYNNGASGIGATLTNSGALAALVLDSYTVQTNDRLLIKDQSSTFQDGIYVATNVGSGAVAWVLTRSTDFDQPSEIQPGDLVIVNNGTVNAGTSWIQTDTVSAVGTDPIQFSQFTFSATSVLLKANNLNDVANKTTSFNNISPLTTKGDLIGYSTQNIRVAVGGTNTQILQVDSTAAAGISWSTATYPKTTTVNQILYSSLTNTVTGISTLAGGVLVTDASSVPQFLTNPSAAGKVLQSGNSAIATWSTPTYPSTSGTSGKFLISDGTNNVYSTSTIPTSAGATANKVLLSDGTNYVLSTPTFPNASATSGKIIVSDGTNWIASTPTFPNASATAGKIIISDGTNWIASTPTYPNSSATTRKILVSDGTNFVASTETWAVPGTSGNVLTSDGTNWTSAAPAINSTLTTKGDLLTFTTVLARLPVATGDGKILQVSSGASTGLAYSTPTYPSASGTSGLFLISDGTNNVYSTSTIPTSAGATANKILLSNGTNYVLSTPTFPNASATSGKIIVSDGTNWIASTPTFPNASATTRKIIVSDGTNWVASTETYAVPGTSGNVLTSDGTNWTSAAPATGGTVTSVATSGLATGGTITSTGTITVSSASASDMVTATSTTKAVTPAVVQNHPGVCKAWAYITSPSSSPPTISASYNVTSITRNSTGVYTIVLTTGFSSSNYAILATINDTTGILKAVITNSTTFVVTTVSRSAGTVEDHGFYFACLGTQ